MKQAPDRRTTLENELDALREQLLVADEEYENASTTAKRDVADRECQRLRGELRARREELRNLNAEGNPHPRVKAQGVGK